MSDLTHVEDGGSLSILSDGVHRLTYVFEPTTPANESPRPYVHPLSAPTGELLTLHRPNDHPWHHALSLTLTRVGDVNFWGGPSYRAVDGYRWRNDHGRQVHLRWHRREGGELAHELAWVGPDGAVLMREERTLRVADLPGGAWSLAWESTLANATDRALALGNYHASGGLAGSHYTGLQFRGTRGLLDQHGDPSVTARHSAGPATLSELHGAAADWLEWDVQHDGTLRRTRLRFESMTGPLAWFFRPDYPLVAFAPHREEELPLGPGAVLHLRHRLSFLPL